ncbi:antifungal protein ginkbilobin-like protein [Syzygium oleosum]|uniref:antifungal protein ginkbilobin-like protein n=1 Tax=Syzygium oleosum TaxID=219896 RepID=UPI0011D1C370|nr:antifungal protein ginkbilobin-like protein [Syzygium oleosum]
MAEALACPGGDSHNSGDHSPCSGICKQDRYLPFANISRIMEKAFPADSKITKDTKEIVQERTSEFIISFITKVYYICSERRFSPLGEYELDRGYAMEDLCSDTSLNGYNYYIKSGAYYGHGVCNGALTQPDCNDCLSKAVHYLYDICDVSLGAQIQLKDCRIRYEDHPFH